MTGWNDERVEILKKLWAEGLSASQIAARLKGTSRNAVISKVHRLGLSGRVTTLRMKSNRPRTVPQAAGKPKPIPRPAARPMPKSSFLFSLMGFEAEPFKPQEELDIPLEKRRSLVDLQEKDCRWPIGDPMKPDFHFCNRDKVPGLPYCEFHARRAFQPPQPRRRDVKEPAGTPPEQIAGPVKTEEVA